jgi:hypothetical protein
MTMPNFLIIGAAKAGTTSLHHYLRQHPEIYMAGPKKELRFFALEGEKLDFRGPGDQKALRFSITDVEAYRRKFDGVSDEKAIGESSPLYIYSPKAPGRIAHYIPDAKLIAVLRNPVERAYSCFLHLVRDGREPLDDFSQALREEEARIERNYEPGWHYKEGGFYYAQLSRYFGLFDRQRIRVYLYEDWKADPTGVLGDIFEFLEVDKRFVPDMSVRHNVSGVPRNKTLHALLTKSSPIKAGIKPLIPTRFRKLVWTNLKNRNLREPPSLSPEVRGQLIETYREDVLKLQALIGRDLSRWLE